MKKAKTKRPTRSHQKRHSSGKPLQTFGDHIAEIRRRLFVVGIAFFVGSILAYQFRHELLGLIMAPLKGQQLVYLTPGGGFSFIFQIVIYAGLVFAAPVLVHQFHAFIRPALPERAQKSVLKLTLMSTLLICGGVAYGYVVAVPAAITFLSGFAEGAVAPNLTADSYLSFFLAYIGGLALLSLIPLVVIFWHWIKPISPSGLFRGEQWVILIAFILAAIITPTPDVVNQTMIAAPIIAVYQLGVASVLVSIVRNRKRLKKHVMAEPAAIDFDSLLAPEPAEVATPLVQEAVREVVQPVIMRPPVWQQHRVRSVDGFSAPSKSPIRPQASRLELQLPQRQKMSIRTSHRLSIDGFSR